MIIPALAALNAWQKILGVVLSIALWLAPAAGTWLYMRGELKAQFALGQVACEKANALALGKANTDAIGAWKKAQADVAGKARAENEKIAAEAYAAVARIAGLSKGYTDYALAHPLPAGCRLDAERVRQIQAARDQAAGTAAH